MEKLVKDGKVLAPNEKLLVFGWKSTGQRIFRRNCRKSLMNDFDVFIHTIINRVTDIIGYIFKKVTMYILCQAGEVI